MLRETFPREALAARLIPLADHHPFPPAAEREAWEGLLAAPVNRERLAWAAGQGEAVATQPWPELPAARYMDFVRNGDRKLYETPYFGRRQRIGQLALAECLEYRGRWLDAIIDGVWLLLGEPTWCVPAHAPHLEGGDPLPDPDGRLIDLFCCETGFMLAELIYVLGPELEKVSPSLVERVRRAVVERVISPVEQQGESSAWWFNGHNNWTPWCASNVLGAACYLLDDTARLAALADQLNVAVDRFIANYGDDGGCDEGPMYWGKAAGALFDYLTRLEHRLDGEMELFRHPKIKAMAEFYDTAQLHDEWVLNFADAPARGRSNPTLLHEFGRRVGSRSMMDLGLFTQRGFKLDGEVGFRLPGGLGNYLHTAMQCLFLLPLEWTPRAPEKALSKWLPDVQVAVLRQSPQTGAGLILGAKGGHNAESHNHNDVGNFVVMLDGEPGIADVGTATYTRFTFGPQRYDLWYIRGAAHNAPVIGGVEQHAGHEFAARDVAFTDDGSVATLAMELARAYPANAGVTSLRRELTFDRGASRIRIADRVAFSGSPKPVVIHLYTPRTVAVEDAVLRLEGKTGRALRLEVSDGVEIAVERVPLTDPQTRGFWGDHLNRIDLTIAPAGESAAYDLTLEPEA